MPIRLNRLMAALLLPCLLADPRLGAAFAPQPLMATGCDASAVCSGVFASGALIPAASGALYLKPFHIAATILVLALGAASLLSADHRNGRAETTPEIVIPIAAQATPVPAPTPRLRIRYVGVEDQKEINAIEGIISRAAEFIPAVDRLFDDSPFDYIIQQVPNVFDEIQSMAAANPRNPILQGAVASLRDDIAQKETPYSYSLALGDPRSQRLFYLILIQPDLFGQPVRPLQGIWHQIVHAALDREHLAEVVAGRSWASKDRKERDVERLVVAGLEALSRSPKFSPQSSAVIRELRAPGGALSRERQKLRRLEVMVRQEESPERNAAPKKLLPRPRAKLDARRWATALRAGSKSLMAAATVGVGLAILVSLAGSPVLAAVTQAAINPRPLIHSPNIGITKFLPGLLAAAAATFVGLGIRLPGRNPPAGESDLIELLRRLVTDVKSQAPAEGAAIVFDEAEDAGHIRIIAPRNGTLRFLSPFLNSAARARLTWSTASTGDGRKAFDLYPPLSVYAALKVAVSAPAGRPFDTGAGEIALDVGPSAPAQRPGKDHPTSAVAAWLLRERRSKRPGLSPADQRPLISRLNAVSGDLRRRPLGDGAQAVADNEPEDSGRIRLVGPKDGSMETVLKAFCDLAERLHVAVSRSRLPDGRIAYTLYPSKPLYEELRAGPGSSGQAIPIGRRSA